MKYNKIALVNPPLDEGVVKCIDDGFWQPLNLLTLASYIRANGYEGEIRILDQSVASEKEISDELKAFEPDLVGISPNMDSYGQALRIASEVKENGSDVVLGGAYATTLAENILSNRQFIDFVIAYEGEIAFLKLLQGDEPDSIPNLVYRCGGKVICNKVEFIEKASLCEVDYSLIDMTRYFKNYSGSINPGEYKKPITIITQRGCVWREKTQGCIFCSRINQKAIFDNHDDIWRQIGKLREKYDMDSVIDVGDDFLGNPEWFKIFYHSRPDELRDIGIRFIYSRVEHINESTADMLRELNVSEICLGLESGDVEILTKVRKGNTPRQHLNAVKLLAERNIKIIAAFMLGHPAESEVSIGRTKEHVSRVLEFKNTNELVVSLFTPLPGSLAYRMLLEKSKRISAHFKSSDLFHVREFQKEWVGHFCRTDFETILRGADELGKLHRRAYIEFA